MPWWKENPSSRERVIGEGVPEEILGAPSVSWACIIHHCFCKLCSFLSLLIFSMPRLYFSKILHLNWWWLVLTWSISAGDSPASLKPIESIFGSQENWGFFSPSGNYFKNQRKRFLQILIFLKLLFPSPVLCFQHKTFAQSTLALWFKWGMEDNNQSKTLFHVHTQSHHWPPLRGCHILGYEGGLPEF